MIPLAVRSPTLAALAGALMLLACSDGSEPPAPVPPTPPAVPPEMPPAVPREAPPAAEPPPGPGTGDASRGETQYAALCASCHGRGGGGAGPLAASLDPKPARHDDGHYMNGLSNDHLFTVIQRGGGAVGKSQLMGAWGGVLDDQQIRDVIAYIRTLAKPPYPSQGS